MERILTFVTTFLILSMMDELECFTLKSSLGDEMRKATEFRSEIFDPQTQGEEVKLNDGSTAILLQPVNQRKRRQVVVELPTEDQSCKFHIRECETKNGTCLNVPDRNVCQTSDNFVDFDSKTCASSQINGVCQVVTCQDTQRTGRCISLRGGTKACEGSGQPRYLVPDSRECL